MANFVACSLNLFPLFSFSSFKPALFFMFPLAVLCRIYVFDLNTTLVITGMRGAKAGVSPPRRSPPYKTTEIVRNEVVEGSSNDAMVDVG